MLPHPLNPEVAKWTALAALMRDLLTHPGWEAYRSQLEQQEAVAIEALISDPTVLGKGFIQGLRTACNLPQRIIDQTAKLVTHGIPE